MRGLIIAVVIISVLFLALTFIAWGDYQVASDSTPFVRWVSIHYTGLLQFSSSIVIVFVTMWYTYLTHALAKSSEKNLDFLVEQDRKPRQPNVYIHEWGDTINITNLSKMHIHVLKVQAKQSKFNRDLDVSFLDHIFVKPLDRAPLKLGGTLEKTRYYVNVCYCYSETSLALHRIPAVVHVEDRLCKVQDQKVSFYGSATHVP